MKTLYIIIGSVIVITVICVFLIIYKKTTDNTPPTLSTFGVSLKDQKALACPKFWQYSWGKPVYGTPADQVGVLQVVNGGNAPMWIRYAGLGIDDWAGFITTSTILNGNTSHLYNKLNTNGMLGQGDGFKLNPGEYQILPFKGRSCWLGGSLGCGKYGNDCDINPGGRGSGLDSSPTGQPNTLFEWTVPGVWDASLVDGFNLPMKIEVDGCDNRNDCGGSYGLTNLNLSGDKCPNKIINPQGKYVGCKSMCACQNNAIKLGQLTDPACPGMHPVDPSFVNKPLSPGGYCGCECPNTHIPRCQQNPGANCVDFLHQVFKTDKAGMTYCDSITDMTKTPDGKRAVYCQAYDDDAGTRSYGNGVIKVTIYNAGFEWAVDFISYRNVKI